MKIQMLINTDRSVELNIDGCEGGKCDNIVEKVNALLASPSTKSKVEHKAEYYAGISDDESVLA